MFALAASTTTLPLAVSCLYPEKFDKNNNGNSVSSSRFMDSYRSALESRYEFNNRPYLRSPSLNFSIRKTSASSCLPDASSRYSNNNSISISQHSTLNGNEPSSTRLSRRPPLPETISGRSYTSSAQVGAAASKPPLGSRTSAASSSAVTGHRRCPSSDRRPIGTTTSPGNTSDPQMRALGGAASRVTSLARRFENSAKSGSPPSSTSTSSSNNNNSGDDRKTPGKAPEISTGDRYYHQYSANNRHVPSSYVSNSSASPLYRARFGALSVPDVPSYIKQLVVHELDDDEAELPSAPPPSTSRSQRPANSNTAGNESTNHGASSLGRNRAINNGPASNANNSSENAFISSDSINKKGGLVGLRNLGNTCFMNCVIQCLSHTRLLRDYCLNSKYSPDINSSSRMKGALIKAFSDLLNDLWSSSKSGTYISPDKFKLQIQKFAPRFTGYSQQDAQEFLRYLLQGLHEDVNRVQGKPGPLPQLDDNVPENQKAIDSWKRYLMIDDSKIVDIFVGQLKSELKCTHCGHVSTTYDPFWDLSLPIPQTSSRLASSSSVSLNDCMEAFTKEEILDGDEKPTCERCKTRRKCSKKFTIQKFPPILVLHLKRFSGERYRSRLSTLVQFPLTKFDLSAYSSHKSGSTTPRYDLYAVSNHTGTPLMGHYTAYCKRSYEGAWCLFDDTRVTPVSESTVISSEAYVLFYEINYSSYNNNSDSINGNNHSSSLKANNSPNLVANSSGSAPLSRF